MVTIISEMKGKQNISHIKKNKGHNSKMIKEKIIQNTIIREVTLKCNRK
jgi:hypothetical protein